MKTKEIFILGASGFIGGYLFNHLKNQGKKVIGTYNKNKKTNLIFFDAIKSSINELQLNNIKYGIICSAISKIDECKKNQEYSNSLTMGLEKIIKRFKEKSIIPVFISSAAVFDGLKGGCKEEDLRNPQNLYGIQKKEIEDFITSNFKDYLVIRFNKIFGVSEGDGNIFLDWFEKYKNNQEIRCIYDEDLSLTYIKDAVEGIEKLLKKGNSGIFHVDSGIHKSRLEFARDFFKYLDIDNAKIKKCSLKDFNFIEKRAKKSYLDSSKFISETGFKFTSMEDCYQIIKNEL